MNQRAFGGSEYALAGMVVLLTFIRIAVAPTFGLGVDEAHYFLYAKYLDLSYVDHPPLVGWAHFPLYRLFGTNEFLVRLPAIIVFAAVSILSYRFALSLSGRKSVALMSVLAINSSFILNAMSLMLLPDCFLLLFIFPLMAVIIRIEETGRWKDFIYLGLLMGAAGLAKYTAILFVVPLILYYILKKRPGLLVSPRMFLAAFIALLMVSPVVYWNDVHDFISFRYQGSHVLGPATASVKSFLTSLLAQLGAYSPFLFIIAFYGFIKGFATKNDRIRLALLFGGTLLLFFLYSSFYERTLPHWPSLFYLLFIPVGVHYLWTASSRAKKNFLFFSIGFSLFLTLFLYAELSGKWFTFPDYKSPFRDIYGFNDIAREASSILEKESHSRTALAVTNWTMGSRLIYYSLPYQKVRVFVLDQRIDQFDVWEKVPPMGYDVLFVNTHFHDTDIDKTYKCDACQPVKSLEIVLNGGKVDSVQYVWCRNYRGFR